MQALAAELSRVMGSQEAGRGKRIAARIKRLGVVVGVVGVVGVGAAWVLGREVEEMDRVTASSTLEELADTCFEQSDALWADPKQRERAKELARQAYRAYSILGPSHAREAAEVEAWLASH